MKNIFTIKTKKSNAKKSVVWLVAFSLMLHGSAALPLVASATGSSHGGHGHKVVICHIPQGNPANMQTIEVDEHSVTMTAHLQHGDTVGPCTPPPPPQPTTAKIIATKIVCDSETKLPNWGAGGPNITSTTATNYVATHPGCVLASGWQFQWGYSGVKDLTGDFVGTADGSKGPGTQTGTGILDWKTFGATNSSGVATVDVTPIQGSGVIWLREVLKQGYIPFTFDPAHQTNANPVSAEMYCHGDVLNYDNYDYVSSPVAGGTYYCVAFNVQKSIPPPPPPPEVCEVDVVSDTHTILGNGNYAFATYDGHTSWTASIPGATWIWSSVLVQNPTQNEYETFTRSFFLPTAPVGASLVVAADNSYGASINGTVMGSDNTEYNYFESGKDTYNVLTNLHSGTNTLSFTVKNWAQAGGSPQTNPAGLLFKLHAELSGDDCEPPPPPPPDPDNTKPVITLRGVNPMQVGLGFSYAEPSADVADAEDGDIDGKLMVSGFVNTGAIGSYTISYNATDSQNLAADTKTRTVNVVAACSDGADNDNDQLVDYPSDPGCDGPNDNSENKKPVITVLGSVVMSLLVGTSYVDDSATVLDQEDGDITNKLVTAGAVDANTVGGYTITYNATDSEDVAADQKSRTVNVVAACSDGADNDGDQLSDYPTDPGCDNPNDNDENTKPVITVLGANPMNLTQGDTFTDPTSTAADPEDGDITANIVTTGTVDTNTLGSYTITYNVSDSKGLAADQKTRVVNVNPPVTECNDGADNDGDQLSDYPTDPGCDNPNDNDENTKPVITVLGNNPMTVYIGTTFTDPASTASDPEDGDITVNIVTAGTVDTSTLGAYTITYNVSDSKGLAADQKTRVVNVVSACSDGKDNDGDQLVDYPADPACDDPMDDDENAKPVITLLGDVVMNLFLGTSYVEPSATVLDQEDGNITNKLVTAGTVDTNTLGAYTITYNATDSKDVAADQKSRTVNVVSPPTPPCTQNCGGGSSNQQPVITLSGDNPMSVTQGNSFVDPRGTAQDPEDGDITAKIIADGVVDVNTLGAYTITYNATDSQFYYAQPRTRTVNVVPGTGCTTNCGGGGGGGPTQLVITDEKLQSTGDTTVVVTWKTNMPATSRVVYGLDPVILLAVPPLYGYTLSTGTTTVETTTHSVTIEGIPSGASAYFRPVSSTNTQTATGIELTRGAVLGECTYLKEYMRLGMNNNPVEVTKLQSFLRSYEGHTSLEVTGFFDITTDRAVRAFQDKYKADVLDVWNLPANTGYVYYTTQKKVNEIYCQTLFPLNEAQVAEIASYRALIAEIGRGDTAGGTAVSATVTLNPTIEVELLGGVPSIGATQQAESVGTTDLSSVVAIESMDTEPTNVESEPRRRIAIADLLATAPSLGRGLQGTQTDTESDQESGVVAGASTDRGLAFVLGSLSERTQLSPTALSILFIILLTALVLAVIAGKKYMQSRQAMSDAENEMN